MNCTVCKAGAILFSYIQRKINTRNRGYYNNKIFVIQNATPVSHKYYWYSAIKDLDYYFAYPLSSLGAKMTLLEGIGV